jgi:hypothetical protein
MKWRLKEQYQRSLKQRVGSLLGAGAHACNPSYSGGRNQEDHSLKPTQENSLQDGISKNPFTKKGW